MDRRSKLVVALLAVSAGPSFAFYVTPSTPPGWVNAAATGATYRASPSDISFANGIRQKIGGAAVNVGGKTLTLATAYKYTADASKVAARFAYANPLLFVGILAGTAAAAYYLSPTSDLVVDDGQWKVKQKDMQCLAFVGDQPAHSTVYGYAGWSESFSCYPVSGGMMWGWTVKGPDGQTWKEGVQPTKLSPAEKPPVPITETDYVNRFMNDPVPPGVPQVLPVPLPVGQPIVNPSPDAIPVPQPLRVPQGEPQAIPGTDPKQWRSPAVDIVPSPTITDPWRVDVQPKDVISTDPAPLPETAPVPHTPDPNTSTSPTAETLDLCEKNPEILACQKVKLGELPPVPVVDDKRTLRLAKDSGWGPESGSCPAPKTASVMGVSLSMPFDLLCDFANAIRPLLIAFAWLSSALTFFGFSRK